jgi:hypothetical protein
MKAESAIKLIVACRKNGVTRLKFGTLEIELDHNDETKIRTRASGPALKASKEEIIAQEERSQLQFQLNEAKDDLSTLHVEDPMAFEKAIVENELVDQDAGGDDIEEACTL